jgi:hypothetical protein
MKKVIKYDIKQGNGSSEVVIDYNSTNLEIAKKESVDGKYTIVDLEENEGVS